MKELIAELKKLNVVAEKDGAELKIGSMRIAVEVETKDINGKEKTVYRVADKVSTSVSNIAYWLITEYIPARLRREELMSLVGSLKGAMPKGTELFMARGDAVILSVKTADELRAALKAMAATL